MTLTVYADEEDISHVTVPSNAVSYSATKCANQFTTKNFLTKPSGGYPSMMTVIRSYINWDGYTEFDMFMYTKPKDEHGKTLTTSWVQVYCGYDGVIHGKKFSFSPNNNSDEIHLLIKNPYKVDGALNYENDYAPISNMVCRGDFWF